MPPRDKPNEQATDPFDRFYAETSIRLPDTFWCYDPLTSEPPVNALPAAKNGHITFGSLNNFFKLNPGVLAAWASVLKAVDRSRLLLLAPEGSSRQWVSRFRAARRRARAPQLRHPSAAAKISGAVSPARHRPRHVPL